MVRVLDIYIPASLLIIISSHRTNRTVGVPLSAPGVVALGIAGLEAP